MLILVRGLPGSGKSTFAKNIAIKLKNAIHIEADMFFLNKNGIYEFDAKKIKEAHEWCQKLAKETLIENNLVIVSNTFSQIWELKPYIKMAEDLKIISLIFKMNTQYNNIHNVPDSVIERMNSRWEKIPGESLVSFNKEKDIYCIK